MIVLWSGILAAALAGSLQTRPAEDRDFLDVWFQDQWKKRDLKPAGPCEDAAFLRRVSLDLTGTLPDPEEVRAFLRSVRQDKRSVKIDELIATPRAAEYFAYTSIQW